MDVAGQDLALRVRIDTERDANRALEVLALLDAVESRIDRDCRRDVELVRLHHHKRKRLSLPAGWLGKSLGPEKFATWRSGLTLALERFARSRDLALMPAACSIAQTSLEFPGGVIGFVAAAPPRLEVDFAGRRRFVAGAPQFYVNPLPYRGSASPGGPRHEALHS